MGTFFEGFLIISAVSSIFIILIALISPFLKKGHTVFWRYILWIALGIRLALPFDISMPEYAVSLPFQKNADLLQADKDLLQTDTDLLQKDINAVQKYTDVIRAEPELFQEVSKGNENTLKTVPKEQAGKRELDSGRNGIAGKNGNTEASNNAFLGKKSGKGIFYKNYAQWLFFVWAMVAAVLCLVQGASYWIFCRKLKRTKRYLWNKENVPVYCSKAVQSPMLVGIWKPQIILPEQNFTNNQLEFAVSHEFAHYKRKDLAVKLLLAWCRTLHWFNPFVYFMEQRAEKDIELLCDSQVVCNFSKEEKKQYGEMLLAYASGAGNGGSWLCVSRFSKKTHTLKERFLNIFSGTGKRKGAVISVIGIGVVLSASLFLAFGMKENVSAPENGKQKAIIGSADEKSTIKLAEPEKEIEMPELSVEKAAKMRYGAVMPQLVYISTKRAIIYDYWGMLIYDVKAQKIEQMLDLPALDLAHVQGSTATHIEVSKDGNQILFYNRPKTKERFLYDIDKKKLQYTGQEHLEHIYDDTVSEDRNENPFTVLNAAETADMLQARTEILDTVANTSAIAYLTWDSLKTKNGKIFHEHDLMGLSLVIKFNGLGEAQIYPLFKEYYEAQDKTVFTRYRYKDVEHQPAYVKYLYEDENGWKYSLEQDKKKESRIQEFASVLDPLLLVRTKDGKRQVLEDLIIPEMVSWNPILFVKGRIIYMAAPNADMGGIKDPVLVSIALDGSDRRTADDVLYHDFDHLCEDKGWIYYAGWTQDNGFPQPLCRISADFHTGPQFVQNIPGRLIGVENDIVYYLADSTKSPGIYWLNLKTGEERLYDKWGVPAEDFYFLNSRETQFIKEGKEGLVSGSHLIFSYDYQGEVYTTNVEFKVYP